MSVAAVHRFRKGMNGRVSGDEVPRTGPDAFPARSKSGWLSDSSPNFFETKKPRHHESKLQ